MATNEIRLNIIAGADFQDTITIKDGDGVVIDISGAEIKFKIAKNEGVTNANAVFYVSTADATYLTITDGTNGVVTLDIPASVTKNFTAGTYLWSIRYIETDSDVFETDTGIAVIEEALIDDE